MELKKFNTQKELTDYLDIMSQNYYTKGESDISDTEFDLMLKQLQKMEKQSGQIYPNSPTQRVGSDLREEFGKVVHPNGYPMLTIENCYNDEELAEWLQKMHLKYNAETFNISLKYDGISCELRYLDGLLFTGSTRGDKIIGDDITDNVKTIKSIPLSIPIKDEVYFRGEILLPKSELERINKEKIANGEEPFKNCRNACSGSVKQLDSKITASRNLIFRPWDVLGVSTNQSQTMKNNIFKDCGFVIDEGTESIGITYHHCWSDESVEKIIEIVRGLWEIAKNMDYDCDGIVIKIDDVNVQKNIGTKDNRAIEWGIARKWNEENMVQTELFSVDWQVGRTGNLTPVGRLDPVECDGVTISNVTLNNVKFIKEHDIHIGNDLIITRSGGVIPYVLGVKHDLLMEMNNAYKPVEIPTICPVCGTELVMDGEILKCPNSEGCRPQIEGRIEQWCSKDCMDIPDVGPAMIHDLVEKELVDDPLDLYFVAKNYKAKELVEILGKGYGEKSLQKFISNIKKSLHRPFEKVIFGLSIDGVGKQNAKLLAEHFGSYEALSSATQEELEEIDGIGPVLAQNIVQWFLAHDYHSFLYEYGFNLKADVPMVFGNDNLLLGGLNIVFSGKSDYWDGDEVEEVLESYGAKCSHSITKKTNYLVIGKKPGPSKMKKAEELGIEIIKEVAFLNKFKIPRKSEIYTQEISEDVSDENVLFNV